MKRQVINMKKRIWELDFLRGVCILGVVIVHLIYDLVDLYKIIDWEYPAAFKFIKDWGGIIFILLSGVCVTLGSRSVRRGILVFLCGMICTAVTYGMYHFKLAGQGIIIYFGVLHCLGVCMLLWPLFKKCPWWLLAVIGLALTALGFYIDAQVRVEFQWLVPLGLHVQGFQTSDYFPLLPYLGFFLLGAVLGRTAYAGKETLLPRVNENNPLIRFFLLCGKHSLWIYLLHQPVLSGICYLIITLQ